MRSRILLSCLIAALLAGLVPTLVAPAFSQTQRQREVERKISATRQKIGKRKGTERVLTKDIARWSDRIGRLEGSIDRLQTRQQRIEADLEVRSRQLDRTQRELRHERARLTRLRIRLAEGQEILADRLVQLYQADPPDLVSVVLDSSGFADLVQRSEFLARVQEQDANVMRTVTEAKRDATDTAARLTRLERRQSVLTEIVKQRRDEVASVKQNLIDTRVGYQRTKAGKDRALRNVRAGRKELEDHLQSLLEESSKIQAQLSGIPDTPIRQGSGRFIWPINGTLTSPFCESRSWESCHPGIDVAAPTGTPIRAADSGTVRLAGPTGGYGNYTCIQHTTLLSTCYAHQSAIHVRVGQSVSKGQVIGLVGSTGFSTGPHLHFEVRINGAVQNPMAYL